MATAFSGAEDPSMNVRLRNREIIRSYIKSNPIGYGLGATGYLGKKYTPGTFIGEFATDSEYVKTAVELGWIGLFLWCTILAVLFGYGVAVYFREGGKEWRPIVALVLTLFFMIIVASYTQEVFISVTISILFSSLLGILAKVDTMIKAKTSPKDIDE
jgi:putative inorganic carbon (HCO3(-)) transporter